MKIIKKLTSKRGQISMEIGIITLSFIVISTIASYYYLSRVSDPINYDAGKNATKTIGVLKNKTIEANNHIKNISII